MSDDLRAAVEAYNDAWNRQDLDAIMVAHSDDLVFHNHTAGECAEGAAAVRAHIGSILERWPDMRFRNRNLYVGDDFVVSEWTATATTTAGERIEWDGIDVFPFENGKIKHKDVYSTSHRPRRLGWRTPPQRRLPRSASSCDEARLQVHRVLPERGGFVGEARIQALGLAGCAPGRPICRWLSPAPP